MKIFKQHLKCNFSDSFFHQVLAEMKKSNFTLLNERILFDENGDPTFGSFSVVFWNHSGFAQDIGFYNFPPSFKFFINSSKIQWHGNGEVYFLLLKLQHFG